MRLPCPSGVAAKYWLTQGAYPDQSRRFIAALLGAMRVVLSSIYNRPKT